jgi:hypothetical protein
LGCAAGVLRGAARAITRGVDFGVAGAIRGGTPRIVDWVAIAVGVAI